MPKFALASSRFGVPLFGFGLQNHWQQSGPPSVGRRWKEERETRRPFKGSSLSNGVRDIQQYPRETALRVLASAHPRRCNPDARRMGGGVQCTLAALSLSSILKFILSLPPRGVALGSSSLSLSLWAQPTLHISLAMWGHTDLSPFHSDWVEGTLLYGALVGVLRDTHVHRTQ